MATDEVFKNPITQSSDFKFDQKVVTVFDDMVTRSVPYYLEMQRMIGELAQEYARVGTNVYDLGCSTGTTMKNMDNTHNYRKFSHRSFEQNFMKHRGN